MMNRTIASKIKNQLEYIDHGDGKWTQKTYSTFKNFQIDFKLGEKFDEQTADGRKCEVLFLKHYSYVIPKYIFTSL